MSIFIVAATDKNRGIGYQGQLPWVVANEGINPYPQDMEWVKNFTRNKNVVYGGRTWREDLKCKPLPHRFNFILSNTLSNKDEEISSNTNVLVFNEIHKLIDFGVYNDLYVMGGAEIYRQFLPSADVLFLSEFEEEYDCDVYFPDFDPDEYEITNGCKAACKLGYVSKPIHGFKLMMYEAK